MFNDACGVVTRTSKTRKTARTYFELTKPRENKKHPILYVCASRMSHLIAVCIESRVMLSNGTTYACALTILVTVGQLL
jgi:hypothetical protein